MIKKIIGLSVDEYRIFGNLLLPDSGDKGPYPVLALCHGIPGLTRDVGERSFMELAERVSGEGIGALVFSFRGTGSSGGNLDMLGWTRDLETAVNYLTFIPEADKSRIFLWGFSAGAAVALYVAARNPGIAGVAACACPAEQSFIDKYEPQSIVEYFRGIGLISERGFPPSVEEWLNGFRQVSPIDCVDKLSPRPLLLVHGDKDKVVRVSQARKLYKAAGEPKELRIIPGADHSLMKNEPVLSLVLGWLKAKAGVKAAGVGSRAKPRAPRKAKNPSNLPLLKGDILV